jgi:hypothetical protein
MLSRSASPLSRVIALLPPAQKARSAPIVTRLLENRNPFLVCKARAVAGVSVLGADRRCLAFSNEFCFARDAQLTSSDAAALSRICYRPRKRLMEKLPKSKNSASTGRLPRPEMGAWGKASARVVTNGR